MSKKENKFQPSAGFVVAVHQNILGMRAVADELDIFPEALGEAMDKAGFQFVPDPFNLSNDARKVIELQERHKTSGLKLTDAGLQSVKEPSDDSDSNASTD
jgi:hypothetical protein